MNRILVIEPSQMLRHAFAVALSPEYQVETMADFPDETVLDRADLMIVNAATLKAYEKLNGNELERVRDWEKAVIWIDAEQIAAPGESSKCLRLRWPIDREGLRKAIANCLQESPETSGEMLTRKRATQPVAQTVQHPKAASTATERREKRLIELVDIVE